MSIRRLYVGKKPDVDIESKSLFYELTHLLNIEGLQSVRIWNRYDVENIGDDCFAKARNTIFAELPVDDLLDELLPLKEDETCFCISYLPGQYDQRADSAVQCIQIIDPSENPTVAVAKAIVLKGRIKDGDFNRIKNYCINPVDSMEAGLEKPATLAMEMTAPADVPDIPLLGLNDEACLAMRAELGLAMSEEDFLFCRDYFVKQEKRNPTETEIKMIDTYWSDHCRHTTFLTKINRIDIQDGPYKKLIENALSAYHQMEEECGRQHKDLCLMELAVIGMKWLKEKGMLNNLDESEEINACSIVVPVDVDGQTEEWLVQFKNETHNHPTEIEPFGGAATCLGGAIRDPLSGRAYVYQAMRVTGSGDPRTPIKETLPGKLPQRQITTEAARGYSSYGNQIGLATGQVSEIYHPGYVAKRMELGAVIGAVKKDHVKRETPEAGDVVLLIGGRTGRDGLGGATGSSKEHTADSLLSCGAEVQKGNPPTERKIQRLFRNPEVSRMIKKCNDFGAGGVSVAIGELAEGLLIELDKVPKKYEGLNGTELAISESQERMAVVVSSANADAMIAHAANENLEATKVAQVTGDRRLRMQWRNQTIVDIARDFLDSNGVQQTVNVVVPKTEGLSFFDTPAVPEELIVRDLQQAWIRNLQDLNRASQKGLSDRFDGSIGANTALMPLGGKNQLTPIEAMAAKIPVLSGETNTATLMAWGYNPYLTEKSPYHGAVYAVIESMVKVVATGGDYKNIRLSFQEYFERLGKDPHKWGQPLAALLGALTAQVEMGIAAIGGKDSMSGTFQDIHVPPTLVSFAVAPAHAGHVISPEFKKTGNPVYYVPNPIQDHKLPDFEQLKHIFDVIHQGIKKGVILSASCVKSGGIAEAVSKMCFGNSIGFCFEDISSVDLFKPAYGGFVLELAKDAEDCLSGIAHVKLGETTLEELISVNGIQMPLSDLCEKWQEPLESIFPTKFEEEQKTIAVSLYTNGPARKSSYPKAKPRIFIPVFPGTNCEYDSARAFEKAGGQPKEFLVRNLDGNMLAECMKAAADEIRESQIIMIPGGFSAGDEPDGSGKFIAAVFQNPYISEAVMDLLQNRDGLVLGVCNGFQALVKLGLLPYGEIRDMKRDSPTLTFNRIGRHISSLVQTKVVSNLSPWLMQAEPGQIYTIPVSHGEGRFLASDELLQTLAGKGQIATQYVDGEGAATYDSRFNQNGSGFAVEGLTSEDGRIFGKMGHSERIGKDVYKNIPGEKDQKIFESGVKYFQ